MIDTVLDLPTPSKVTVLAGLTMATVGLVWIGIYIRYSGPESADADALSVASAYNSLPKQTASIPAKSMRADTKKRMFSLGASKSSTEDDSSLETDMRLSQQLPQKSSLISQLDREAASHPKNATSFREIVETRVLADEDVFESSDEEDRHPIECDGGDVDALPITPRYHSRQPHPIRNDPDATHDPEPVEQAAPESQSNLAATYRNQGQLEEAVQLQIRLVETRKKVLGEDHPDTITSVNTLAAMYRNRGQFTLAEQLVANVIERRKKVLGEHHPSTLDSLSNLAATYRSQGRLGEAEQLEIELIATHKKISGEDHPSTLMHMNNLSALYIDQKRFSEAEQLQVKVIEACRKALGDSHPETLSSTNNLALTHLGQGRLTEARLDGAASGLETDEHVRQRLDANADEVRAQVSQAGMRAQPRYGRLYYPLTQDESSAHLVQVSRQNMCLSHGGGRFGQSVREPRPLAGSKDNDDDIQAIIDQVERLASDPSFDIRDYLKMPEGLADDDSFLDSASRLGRGQGAVKMESDTTTIERAHAHASQGCNSSNGDDDENNKISGTRHSMNVEKKIDELEMFVEFVGEEPDELNEPVQPVVTLFHSKFRAGFQPRIVPLRGESLRLDTTWRELYMHDVD